MTISFNEKTNHVSQCRKWSHPVFNSQVCVIVYVNFGHGHASFLFCNSLLQPGPEDLTGTTPPKIHKHIWHQLCTRSLHTIQSTSFSILSISSQTTCCQISQTWIHWDLCPFPRTGLETSDTTTSTMKNTTYIRYFLNCSFRCKIKLEKKT